ncbi:hypothetical protein AVCANL279_06930 [Campylobacter canadensis]|uniref:hypothetical protein n=1 Tax=Campylobacter canadensis TaxID=449520 RepID=UPI001555581B|nr:hypothetical protein [Campylobacter canadensis]MBZ7995404.1 hypothetical protein [Campylobacter canadensis]MBZ7997050.1 hypothetical protein [Campylobacter canadensis]MBZ8000581.1 hypothetical protein [Campylobacter canadensis]MBZ8002333.1 hypothetical protein [Campylobacter canadensis]MBZ8003464.1 hypothetical protein [Campylobacter canadensis]
MYEYKLYYPAGNTTALVKNTKQLDFIKINNDILNKHKNVEQVGFVANNELKMAGGEICFNALRCAAKYFLDQSNQSTVRVKLNKCEYECGLHNSSFINNNLLKEKYKNDNFYYAKIKNNYEIIKINDNEYYVDLGDIFHIVYTKKLDLRKVNLKDFAFSCFQKNNLLNKKACGFMYVQKNVLKPIVWVKEVQTLFYESACGSGSFATFLYFNNFLNKSQLALRQVSKEYLFLYKENNEIILTSPIKDIILD